jgi:hypothetical protein
MHVQRLVDLLCGSPAESGASLWGRLVRHCRNGFVEQRFVEPVEQQVARYVAGLGDADKRAWWSWTEAGQECMDDPMRRDIREIEMDLEMVLLEEVLDRASSEAEEHDPRRGRVRADPRRRGRAHRG